MPTKMGNQMGNCTGGGEGGSGVAQAAVGEGGPRQ